jgi:hypothetical protein
MTCLHCSVCGVLDPDMNLTLPSGLATLRVVSGDWPVGTEVCLEEVDHAPDLSQHKQVILTPTVTVHSSDKHNASNRLQFYFNRVDDYQGFDPTTVNVYQGEDPWRPKGWSAVPPSHVLKDSAGRVIGAKFKLDYGVSFVLSATV